MFPITWEATKANTMSSNTTPIMLNIKLMVIEIKPYQSENALMKLNHTGKTL